MARCGYLELCGAAHANAARIDPSIGESEVERALCRDVEVRIFLECECLEADREMATRAVESERRHREHAVRNRPRCRRVQIDIATFGACGKALEAAGASYRGELRSRNLDRAEHSRNERKVFIEQRTEIRVFEPELETSRSP